jgi:hypothetical protein
MSGSANVRSMPAVTAAKIALGSFADQVEQALALIEVETRRVLDWLQHDRPRHWRNEIRLANDGVAAARAALQRCLMYPLNDERPSCYEEREALKQAQARLGYCEEKVERLKHWKRELEHELFQYQGRISQLVRVVEADVPEAVDLLKKLLVRLEEYQAVRVTRSKPAYDDVAMARQLWPEVEDAKRADKSASGESAEGPPHPSPLPGGEGIATEEEAER